MVSIGSKALLSRRSSSSNSSEFRAMGKDDKSNKQSRGKKGMGRRPKNVRFGFDGDNSNKHVSGRVTDGDTRHKKFWKHQNDSEIQRSVIRKRVDPETVRYYTEIANLFESSGVDLEERSIICGNALEEARGKELELATDYIISHTLQTLLDSCDVDHLCGFLRASAEVFPLIAMDKSGSHVAETALKSLTTHLQDAETYSAIEDTLKIICKVIVANPVDMMCNCYGSHVLRTLLCLCGGVPIKSPEFHGAKPSAVLAERLNLKAHNVHSNIAENSNSAAQVDQGFPGLLEFLVSEILKYAKEDINTLILDQYGSLVLQMALKLLAGQEQELLQIIPILLGSGEGNFVEVNAFGEILELMKEAAYSRLMEVILSVAPKSLYEEMFSKIFRKSLFDLASHHCSNFVVQALVSRARDNEKMEWIWEELGERFADLLEMGRSGVIASLIATSQRLQTHQQKCCLALAAAVCSPSEDPRCIVPRLLFLDSYFSCNDKSSWNWPNGAKIQVMGSLMLQEIFRFQSELIQPYITSLLSIEVDHILDAAKDAGGARVMEGFLVSNASVKQKRRLIIKLRGHFGELALHSSSSFTVEKCFNACNVSLREDIASELLAVQTELSRTKQGPYLLRKLDIERFAKWPDQWRSKQASKLSAYKEFHDMFGSKETKFSIDDSFISDAPKKSSVSKDNFKRMRKEIDDRLINERHGKHVVAEGVKSKKRRIDASATKATENTSEIPFLSTDMKKQKHGRKDKPFRMTNKKLRV